MYHLIDGAGVCRAALAVEHGVVDGGEQAGLGHFVIEESSGLQVPHYPGWRQGDGAREGTEEIKRGRKDSGRERVCVCVWGGLGRRLSERRDHQNSSSTDRQHSRLYTNTG